VERRYRRDRPWAGLSDLIRDEARLLDESFRKIAIDAVHERVNRSGSDSVRPHGHEHRPLL